LELGAQCFFDFSFPSLPGLTSQVSDRLHSGGEWDGRVYGMVVCVHIFLVANIERQFVSEADIINQPRLLACAQASPRISLIEMLLGRPSIASSQSMFV
jgi:hypothetical protein